MSDKKTTILSTKDTPIGTFSLSTEHRIVDGQWAIVCFHILGPWVDNQRINKRIDTSASNAEDQARAYFDEQIKLHSGK
jgi:hypothetical protein